MLNIFKKILISSLFMIAVVSIVNAQSTKNDTIIKLNGKHLIVKIVNNNETNVIFSYPGETMTNTLSKNLIMEIVYSSGRKEKINEKIKISKEGVGMDFDEINLLGEME